MNPLKARGGRRWLRFIGIFAAFVGLIELLLRGLWGFGNPLLLQKDDEIGYLYRAQQNIQRFGNRIQINAFHQRANNVSSTPSPEAWRILFIGDSVTFGTTLLDQSQIISELACQGLRRVSKQPVEVLNASAGSWGLGNQLAYLRRFGTFGAHVVVLQIGSHDLLQEKSSSARIGVDPAMPDKRPVLALSELWHRYLQPRLNARSAPASSTVAGKDDAELFSTNISALTEELALIREAGAEPIVLHTPNLDEVMPGSRSKSGRYAEWRAEFLATLDKANVPVINFQEAWSGEEAPGRFYLDEVHLSAEGNATIARTLVDALLSRSLATKDPSVPFSDEHLNLPNRTTQASIGTGVNGGSASSFSTPLR